VLIRSYRHYYIIFLSFIRAVVLSKPIEKYNGSIGEALRHYYFVLTEAKKERSIGETDKKSKMEPRVMDWFYKTDFWKKHNDNIEFIPQFELGKYLDTVALLPGII